MNLTQDLRLAFPVRWNDAGEPTIYAYHTPISRDVFEANWRIISATAAILLKPGVSPNIISVATLALKDAGRADALENGLSEGLDFDAGGTAVALIGELKRLTLILSPSSAGYEMLPVDVAIDRKVIDADDWAEAVDALIFFCCGWSIATRQRRAASADSLASVIGGSMTSSSPTAFAASLSPSTPATASEPVLLAAAVSEVPQ
jgi:hypothetical protein